MQNVDQQEIEKFAKMAQSWWDPDGDFKPIHRLNPLRLDYILHLSDGLFGKRVLDVGCGGGILAESMARQGAEVTGIDMSPQPLQVAQKHAQQSGLNIDYQQTTIEDFLQALQQQQGEKFDVITCMEMLEHVPDPSAVVRSCQALLKPDGVLFFSTINRTLKAWALVVIGAEYVLKMLPKGTHDYDKFIKPAELLAWCDAADLSCFDSVGYHYNPLSGRFCLNHDVSANYMLAVRQK
ncbi:bifunctional 2-polyprenyl-6-hydroxyphenol methylase/3-demethylubiquinol 3-O-methyltransferase UbiG [Testudinibacter sp. TR-2022]|uniref:bifunctional 2-polyprenyl-6-hydroxyphenol methylase/3-demethylubiquinol 3-O-methyltransferase UbiG n=1 Tax=Testudinibacter sp. TR-2022 TaxID=2585029 RepID=UPI0011181914|nr:bifunctional 2-polyprenyl-6-hydroxyphenol methylase/3-demethylubiquinol 3-O-methyltransferase UbiG [Testudinibacter sp. TR-2022]TNH04423.1 bifunctional 2-polyprenyl-6-hydroxyphenol methylase/3-demethylubiquinol 3-O-methyltransferase UbiG [Pasteurellaceae bacterium Phil11]TNH22681.1 bifunctional 2-polyprenyl-6-hydroxyphenol methylase/3-demethylubiquinol 3-O-methyltransferase UbiG [Testudinibacter sp. TR-2022]TNH28942.1 bifunctional 2-polyprenyl-6-hydroxyphenol methylase/3-demethylubiquinol 3-O